MSCGWVATPKGSTESFATSNRRAEELPEFLGVDDLYDRDAREQLNLAKLSSHIDEQGRRSWPLLITCGPTEFADAFEDATKYRGFMVSRIPVGLLGRAEANEFARWARQRRGNRQRALGEAFQQAQEGRGLFVSLASRAGVRRSPEFGRASPIGLKRLL